MDNQVNTIDLNFKAKNPVKGLKIPLGKRSQVLIKSMLTERYEKEKPSKLTFYYFIAQQYKYFEI